ncbi:MAG: hypothetical protein ABI634_12830 [Acidobacteriota bacterium]
MTTQRTMWIWADTIRQRACTARNCSKPVWFCQNVKTGNYMPFNRPPEALARQNELETNREQWLVDMVHVHWADCAARHTFGRRRR